MYPNEVSAFRNRVELGTRKDHLTIQVVIFAQMNLGIIPTNSKKNSLGYNMTNLEPNTKLFYAKVIFLSKLVSVS